MTQNDTIDEDSKKTDFQCQYCNIYFSSKSNLNTHTLKAKKCIKNRITPSVSPASSISPNGSISSTTLSENDESYSKYTYSMMIDMRNMLYDTQQSIQFLTTKYEEMALRVDNLHTIVVQSANYRDETIAMINQSQNQNDKLLKFLNKQHQTIQNQRYTLDLESRSSDSDILSQNARTSENDSKTRSTEARTRMLRVISKVDDKNTTRVKLDFTKEELKFIESAITKYMPCHMNMSNKKDIGENKMLLFDNIKDEEDTLNKLYKSIGMPDLVELKFMPLKDFLPEYSQPGSEERVFSTNVNFDQEDNIKNKLHKLLSCDINLYEFETDSNSNSEAKILVINPR